MQDSGGWYKKTDKEFFGMLFTTFGGPLRPGRTAFGDANHHLIEL